MSSLIPFIPDWILFILIGVVAIFIYRMLPDDLKGSTKNFLKNYGFYIAIFLLWLYFYNKWGVVADYSWIGQMKYATFLALLGIMLYVGFKSWLYEQRYFTNHLFCDNMHGSCHRYQEIGNVGTGVNWVVFFVDGSGSSDDRFVFPWPWSKRLFIAPKVACQFVGNQIFIKSQLLKAELIDLPEDVADFIEHDTFGRWCKDNIYFGLWSVELKATDPKFTDIELMLQKSDDRINELKEMLRGKLTTVKGFVSDTMAMQEKLKGKSWVRRDKGNYPQEE